MAEAIIAGTSVEHFRAANFIAIGIGLSDPTSSDETLETEVARAPISNTIFGDEFVEFRALIQEKDLPTYAIREIGVFWNGSEQPDSGRLLYRGIVFAKTLRTGNDFYAVLRIEPNVSDVVVPPTRPNRPSPPSVSGAGPTALKVEWVEPYDGGADVTSYDVRYKRTGTSSWTQRSGHAGLQYTIIGLTEETQYDVQVRAVNAVQASLWSNTVVHRTPKQFEFETGSLFILSNGDLYRLDDIQTPSSALKLSDINLTLNSRSITFYSGNIYFAARLFRNSFWTIAIFRIRNYNTTSPTTEEVVSRSVLSSTDLTASVVAGNTMYVWQGSRVYMFNLATSREAGNFVSRYAVGAAYDGSNILTIERTKRLSSVNIATQVTSTVTTLRFTGTPHALAWSDRLILLARSGSMPTLYTVEDLSSPTVTNKGTLPVSLASLDGATWADL